MADPKLHRRLVASPVALFLVAVFAVQAFAWNARIGNIDTYNQLVNTVHFAQTGRFGVDPETFRKEVVPAGGFPKAAAATTLQWVPIGEGGDRYQAHDIGNKLLMTPAAVFTTLVGNQPRGVLTPTAMTKVLAAASIAAFAMLLPLFLLLALRVVLSMRAALNWAALGLVATILLPYVKGTWDVMPCAVLTAGAVWLSLRRLASPPDSSVWGSVAFGALCGGAGLFRITLMPTLVLAFVLTELVVARRNRAAPRATMLVIGAGLAAMVVVLIPEFWVNTSESGRFWRPGVASDLTEPHLLSWAPIRGALGLFASPNRGLLVFSPVFLLLLALPFVWRRLGPVARMYMAVWALPVLGYVLAVGSVDNWGAFGWGPRYFVPIIPVLWVAAACAGHEVLRDRSTPAVVWSVVIGVSVLLAVVPTVTNWDAVSSLDGSVTSTRTDYPKQLVETIRYTGRRIPLERTHESPATDADVDTNRWPDLAVVSATRKAGIPVALGYLAEIALLALAGIAFAAARRAAASDPDASDPDPSGTAPAIS